MQRVFTRTGWSEVTHALWFLPAVAVVVALVAGSVLSRIHPALDSELGHLTFRGDAADARQLLTAVTSTMITVTSLVFVLTVVALQIASTQFSPRLMRTFLRDTGTQVVLSTFVGTVAYSLAGLYTVGAQTTTGERFLPRLAVSGSLVLALISVGMLVYYIQHFTNGIRINTIMLRIEASTLTLAHALPPAGVVANGSPADQQVPDGAVVVTADRSGYVQRFDLTRIHSAAVRDGFSVRYTQTIGYHVVRGRPLAWVWGADAPRRTDAVRAGIVIESERKFENDLGFAIRQMVDIALRAVAPSRNDPYTAVQAIHHLAVIFSALGDRSMIDEELADADGQVRVSAPTMPFETHLRTVCDHLRWSTVTEPRVTLALLRMLGNVGAATPDPRRVAVIRQQIALVLDDAERAIRQPADLETIRTTAAMASGPLNIAGPPP